MYLETDEPFQPVRESNIRDNFDLEELVPGRVRIWGEVQCRNADQCHQRMTVTGEVKESLVNRLTSLNVSTRVLEVVVDGRSFIGFFDVVPKVYYLREAETLLIELRISSTHPRSSSANIWSGINFFSAKPCSIAGRLKATCSFAK